jgi:hypothetical protein
MVWLKWLDETKKWIIEAYATIMIFDLFAAATTVSIGNGC